MPRLVLRFVRSRGFVTDEIITNLEIGEKSRKLEVKELCKKLKKDFLTLKEV